MTLVFYTRVLMLVSLLTLASCAQQTPKHSSTVSSTNRALIIPSINQDKSAQFEREKEKLHQRDEGVNFTTLRMTYTQTPSYDPWDTRLHEASIAMFNAFEDGQYELCLQFANAILDTNFVSLAGHFGAMNCSLALDKAKEAAFHRYVVTGLMVSIEQSGDGLGPETAFVTISPAEMRSFLEVKGMVSYRQELVLGARKHIEKIYTLDADTETHHELYFDNSIALLPGLGRP